MPGGGAARTALRTQVRAAITALPRMASVPDRGLMAMRPDLSQIPERMVGVLVERAGVAAMGGSMDRELQIIVAVRRKGQDAQEQLDLDQDAIEPAVVAAVETGSTICALSEARIEIEGDGLEPLAQLTLTFTVQLYG